LAGFPRTRITLAWLALAVLLLGNLGPAQAAPLRQGGPSTNSSPSATAAPPTIAPVIDEPTNGIESAAAGEALSDPNVRPRGKGRDYDNPAEIDEDTGEVRIVDPAVERNPSAASSNDKAPTVPRLDEPVLRWLPEIMVAAKQWGVPAELVAGVIRLESTGEPGVISPVGARGLMQVMPDNLARLGFPEERWHDPASNVMAGSRMLAEGTVAQGSLEGSIGAYFGFGCDVYGTCTDVYVRVAFGWADYYRPIIADPTQFGFAVLPADWSYGPITLYQVPTPPAPEEPPPPPTPASTTATPTPSPTRTPKADPTRPGDTPRPTETPTTVPAEMPTTVPPPEDEG